MQPDKMRCLMGRDIILFPVLDATEKWIAMADEIPALKSAKVSTWVEKHCTPEEKIAGSGHWRLPGPSAGVAEFEAGGICVISKKILEHDGEIM